ncbi:piggyBac transposable element-derived protein 2-like [Phymastichus coffea]|uniref:piggyBac transposable element-derived protein 2-like n=1 Tax=Phymastichus coffea TaxID=108790 RepID=UPI00273CB778|nr:piggyBac transposable element-derived protein 2-like [Phymastichus coffea]
MTTSKHIFIPNPDDSGTDGDSSSDTDNSESELPDEDNSESEIHVPNVSYRSVFESYTEKQKLLEPNHTFSWCEGEKVYSVDLKDQLLLPDSVKQKISSMSHVELFEIFFSEEIKNYITQASEENDLKLSSKELNTFIGILLLSSYNIRKNQREYWETDPLENCSAVSSAMTRDRFSEIKSKIKYSKPTDKNDNDKAWKVRHILELFRTKIKQFGYFSTALSIDEMMVRFFDRYRIKLWALCGANGYIFNVDIYCGKNDTSIGINLSACPLGSRVVLQMVNPLLHSFSKRKLSDYHVYFDNYFTTPDLVVHLNKCGLRSTGTVRKDRVKQKHDFEKKAPRGTNKASYDRNSGMNLISVVDSKEVSILSTAADVTPLEPMERYSRTAKKRSKLEFPCAFS